MLQTLTATGCLSPISMKITVDTCTKRGVIVKWLELLNGAGTRHKVVSSRLGFAMRQLENSLCQPSSKWVPFSNQGRIRQRKERDGLSYSSAVPKIQWDS